MSAAKKSTSKANAKAAQVQMEYAGDLIHRNIWFKIGLTKAGASMLKTIGRRIFAKPESSAVVLRTLLQVSLAHYDKLERMYFKDLEYSEDEGFYPDRYWHGLIVGQHAKIAKRKGKVTK
jgi:hypothetical protein